MSDSRIRDIAREEIRAYDFNRWVGDLIRDSNYRLKQEIVSHCELKIENMVVRKLDTQRRDIFETLRDFARHDPVVIRNVEQITEEFSKSFTQHCNSEITNAKTAISAHLRSEVTHIGSVEPYQHIVAQMKEDTRKEIKSYQNQTNIIIGGLAIINIGLMAYISRK